MLHLWPEQKLAMYEIFTSLLDDQEVRLVKAKANILEELQNTPAEEFLRDGLASAMTMQLKRQGLADDKIDTYIRNMAEKHKKIEVEAKHKELYPEDYEEETEEENAEKAKEAFKNFAKEVNNTSFK